MLFGILGGVSSVKATKLYANLSALSSIGSNATWNGTTNTISWVDKSNNMVSNFDFAAGNYSSWEKVVVNITSLDNAIGIRIQIRANGTEIAKAFNGTGTIKVNLSDFGFADGALKNVEWIRMLGSGHYDGESHTISSETPGSAVISEVYLEKTDPLTRTVYALGSPISFATALASTDPFVLVQNGKVLCGPLSPSDNSLTFKDVSEISDYSWTIKFEEDADKAGSYFMELYDESNTSKGYVNASVWSHTYLSPIDKGTTKGEQQDGALWTVTETAPSSGKYTIKNLGVTEGSYNGKPNASDGDRAAAGQGYLAITPSGYWANHVTIYNTSGEWEFYTLSTTELPADDHLYYGWDDLIVDGGATRVDENHLVVDARDYAAYWAESAKWNFVSFDATDYRYLVFFSKRNVTQFGNGENQTGGTLFIKDTNGTTFRQDDYTKYKNSENVEKDYPDHIGKIWMNQWNAQRATVLDLQWLANTDKYGDGSECKVLDITKIKEVGVGGTFTIGGIFFTNTLPDFTAGDYKRSFDAFGKYGTICLPYSAVCCGAQLYEIAGMSGDGIALTEYEGIMEAGKPYIYKTFEAKKRDGEIKDETDVYFFKAGYEKVNAPIANKGLVGTFTNTTAPTGDNIYVLSGNMLYTVNSEVAVGANKAYINLNQVPVSSPAPGMTFISFADMQTTGVNDVRSKISDVSNVYYDLQGRKVANPTKGLYIVNGKKVVIK